MGDQRALELVAINIIGNALKFTPDGGVVQVRLSQTNSAVTLVVHDTGLGIPETDLPHVFERFFRSSTSLKHEVQGTGLGLAIAKSIIEQHNGAISLTSRPGEGTTVTVLLLAGGAPGGQHDTVARVVEGISA
jgi:signal transduction histidine kinase